MGYCCGYRIFLFLQQEINDIQWEQSLNHNLRIEDNHASDLYKEGNYFQIYIADKCFEYSPSPLRIY